MSYLPRCPLDKPSLGLSIHDSIHLIHREDWEKVASDARPYLNYDHLMALEDVMVGSMGFRYALFYCEQYQPIGIAYFQLAELVDNGSNYRDAVRKMGAGLGARIVKDLKLRSLVCGNIFHCGEHGAHFINGIPHDEQLKALETAMRQLRSDERSGPKPSVLIFKEFGNGHTMSAAVLEDKGYHPLAMDVNMVMNVDPNWKDLDGYMSVLTSKARTRVKSILDRSSGLEIKELTEIEIQNAIPELQQLFDEVIQRAPFVFGRFNVAVYTQWKRLLGDNLMFHGFYLNDQLVGFSAAFVLKDTLDAQFVGINYGLNQEHFIYQRMLIDLLEFALGNDLRTIKFGRTAEQAKSTIGALPEPLLWYVKHRNRLANKIIGPFIRGVVPTEFELREPFKKVTV
ncbi:MAG: GNAT family N-acetyltransferase [Flavobacteriales bacterium]|nr:GNAT family N-acetyltransferase [Flavobacteriales bacterium]